MENSLSSPSPRSLRPSLFFLLLFLYQVLFTLQGLDLSDEGFFCTFYQQIFDHPDSVQYNFMFWLSGIVGGIFNYVFGDAGVWGLRFFSALFTTATIILVYNLLRHYLKAGYLQIGLFIVLLFMNNNTKVFHYNYLSIFLYSVTALFLFRGLKENKGLFFFFSGICIALDTFSRIPSIVNAGLVIAIFYYGYLSKTLFRRQLLQAVLFAGGFIAGIGGVLFAIKLMGHWDTFKNAIILVGKMGSGGEESAYGIMNLLKQFFYAYFGSLKLTAIILVLLILLAAGVNFLKKVPFYRKWAVEIAKYLLLAALIVLIVKGDIDNFTAIYFATGLSLICGLLVLLSKVSRELKLLTFIGCYILLTYPLGSGAGLYSVGIYSLWFIFPIAVNYFLSLDFFQGSFKLNGTRPQEAMATVKAGQWKDIQKYTVIICIITGLYYSWYYPFFDYHRRVDMRYTVNNKYLKNIYTTRERAMVMTELLNESSKYVKPGDYVLAYHSIPMFHYATHTIPFVHNSMPWFYQASVFKDELDSALNRTSVLPVVVMQKRKTVGAAGSNWPDPAPYYDADWYAKNTPRDMVLDDFLKRYRYRKAWENEMFSIMVPEGK